jgi:hypothetical protein
VEGQFDSRPRARLFASIGEKIAPGGSVVEGMTPESARRWVDMTSGIGARGGASASSQKNYDWRQIDPVVRLDPACDDRGCLIVENYIFPRPKLLGVYPADLSFPPRAQFSQVVEDILNHAEEIAVAETGAGGEVTLLRLLKVRHSHSARIRRVESDPIDRISPPSVCRRTRAPPSLSPSTVPPTRRRTRPSSKSTASSPRRTRTTTGSS